MNQEIVRPFTALRIGAAVLDLLIGFFLIFAATPFLGGNTQLTFAIVAGAGFVYRYFLSATPAQHIMGLRREWLEGRRVVVRTSRRGVSTFAAALVAILYFGLTFGVGLFVRPLVDQKLNNRLVEMKPTAWTPSPVGNAGLSHWIDGTTLSLPANVAGYHAELSSCCVFYGPFREHPVDPGLIVTVSRQNHPYEYCQGVTSRVVKYLSGCSDGPLAFQRSVMNARKSLRDVALSPVAVVRRNFALIAKSMYLEDASPGKPLRVFTNGNAEVLWIMAAHEIRKENAALPAEIDRFFVASDTDGVAVDLIWKGIPRDARVAEQIASTILLREAHPSDIAAETAGAQHGETIAHLYNACRMSHDAPERVEPLVAAIRASGTPRERQYLASHVKNASEHDRRLTDLARSTSGWAQ